MKRLVSLVLLPVLLPSLASAACLWGSFDDSRINYSGGVLPTGAEHSTLRGIIIGNGGTLAASTPTLTAAYLAGVNVFYTSLLNTSTGVLSAAEQAALQAWVAAGGTLIVTSDIFPLPAYDSFTSFWGVTFTSVSTSGISVPIASHAITAGVTSYSYVTNATFSQPANTLVLGNDTAANRFMMVMEPGTGFGSGGRIFVIGDHNMFANSTIGQASNATLATNIVNWACSAIPTPTGTTSWGRLKSIYR